MALPNLYKFPHEKESFQIPFPGSPQQVQYITTLTTDSGENVFMKGIQNMPNADINVIAEKMTSSMIHPEARYVQASQMLTFNLLSNRICEQCGYKTDIRELLICTGCCLAWYCSKTCQENHWGTHRLRCAKKDGPLNTGYQAITLVNTNTGQRK